MEYTKLGDLHDSRAITFLSQDGERRIRKPRSAATELTYKAFLSRLREEGFLYIPGTVDIKETSQIENGVTVRESRDECGDMLSGMN